MNNRDAVCNSLNDLPGQIMKANIHGKFVHAKVVRKFLFFRQVAFLQGERWAYPEPYTYSMKVKWVPSWRIV